MEARARIHEHSAEWLIALSALLIACGGVLLGLQIDSRGLYSGTGFIALGLGALVALVSALVRLAGARGFPRTFAGAFAALASFLGFVFVIGGVLAPGGPWMFFEVLVLLAVCARRPREQERWIGGLLLALLVVFLLFRLWVTYQGSENRWQVLSLPIPVLSWIPFAFLEPIQSVSLGSFTPHELGFPPSGVNFAVSMALWASGFCLCVAGLFLIQMAAREHENDRIHDLIHTLPLPLALLVERLLPEDEWNRLGLHGLAERQLGKRIESLVRDRAQRQQELQRAWEDSRLLGPLEPGGFSGRVREAVTRMSDPSASPRKD